MILGNFTGNRPGIVTFNTGDLCGQLRMYSFGGQIDSFNGQQVFLL